MELPFDADIHTQLENLKEKLKLKEIEITQILQNQKEEFDSTLRIRDQEVTTFVDDIIKENLELKKTILSLEIELENYKEKYQNISDSNILEEHLFYDNIKLIKDSYEIKQKEIIDKYDKLNKNFLKEHRILLNNLRKLSNENKQKLFSNEENNYENKNYSAEDNFNVFENKIKFLYEELKNKEKYSLVLEQKFEMTTEENKMIKRRLQEEKIQILNRIEEINKDNKLNENKLMDSIQTEIYDKQNKLEKEIKKQLENSQIVIDDLIKEKNRLLEEIKKLNENLKINKSEIENHIKNIEEMNLNLNNKNEIIKDFDFVKLNLEKEILQLNLEKEISKKTNEDLIIRFNQAIEKTTQLETSNKLINDSIEREIEKCEVRNKLIIDNLNKETITLNSQIRELKNKLEEEKENSKLLKLKENELNQSNLIIDNLNSEISQRELNLKFIHNSQEDLKLHFDKLQNKYKDLDEDFNNRNNEIKILKEKVAESEIIEFSMKKEIERLNNVKDDLFYNFEEAKKSNVILNSQFETLKMTSNIELNRVRNTISELEKSSEKGLKLNNVEVLNSELKSQIRDYKSQINKIYKTYLNKISNFSQEKVIQQYEEQKMVEEIEFGFDKLINLVSDKIKKENTSIDPKLYEEENKSLKKKLNGFMQITNSLNNSVIPDSNNSFKIAEKENSSSLYESVLIHLKNINVKHLLEIFQLNMQREEEINSLINKNSDVNIVNMKKQLNDINGNFGNLKKLCESVFLEYQQRSKNYIQPEEFEMRLEEYKLFTQNLLDLVLDTLMSYKLDLERNDSVVFQMPVDDYNHFIENISINLDNFNQKINLQLEAYNKYGTNVEKAIDFIIKNTTVDFDLINNLMQEKFI